MKHLTQKLCFTLLLSMAISITAFAEGNIPHLNKSEFEKKVTASTDLKSIKLTGKKPVIVDFYATWCPPCKKLAPVLEEIYIDYKEKIDIYKIDVDQERELANRFNISSIPTLFFINKEGKIETTLGFMPKETLEKKIKEFLLKESKK